MNENTVHIEWTSWLRENSSVWDADRVLYLYGTDEIPFYIGMTYDQNVWKRFISHRRDTRFMERVKCVPCRKQAKVKVGHLNLPGGQRYTRQKLLDIESLLIRSEWDRGRCLANVQKTQFYNNYWLGLIVMNTGYFRPLLKCYREE